MSRTIEAIMAHTAPAKRHAIPEDGKRLTAIWQNGVESAGHVQRKLRLTFMNVSAFQPAIERQNMHARHFDSESHNEVMKRFVFVSAVIFVALLFVGCGRKSQPAGPPAPEVLVTTVQPRDVPRVIERVATLDGFINANINAQVQGYIVSRDYKEGSVVKKGDLLFQIDPRPFEAALAQAKATLAKDQATQTKTDADEKRAIDLFNKKVTSDQERETAIAAAGSSRANVDADEAAVKQAELNLGYTKVISPNDGVAAIATAQVGIEGPLTGRKLGG